MGKNNRQRRAAKHRRQAPRHEPRRGQSGAASLDELFFAASHHTGDIGSALFARLESAPRGAVAATAQRMLEGELSHIWEHGWQPADIDRYVARELSPGESAVLRCCLAAESSRYAALGKRVAPEWMRQLDAVGATRWWTPDIAYLLQLASSWRDTLHSALRLFDFLSTLPELPTHGPPPSQWREGMTTAMASALPPGLLDKVRALLAKAESTTFDAEAEAFTAKAQELMTKHRIDRAVLGATTHGPREQPTARRIAVDDPYAEAKATLLSQIASANGGRAVWNRGLGFSTVFAYTDELDAIEELFVSLLVQATAALQREGSKVDRYGRSRTTRFRRSFLVSFALRIGERLRETVDVAVAAVEDVTGNVLPVLAARDEAVADAVREAFPHLVPSRASITDREGWLAGRLFGDRADVGRGPALDQQAAS